MRPMHTNQMACSKLEYGDSYRIAFPMNVIILWFRRKIRIEWLYKYVDGAANHSWLEGARKPSDTETIRVFTYGGGGGIFLNNDHYFFHCWSLKLRTANLCVLLFLVCSDVYLKSIDYSLPEWMLRRNRWLVIFFLCIPYTYSLA